MPFTPDGEEQAGKKYLRHLETLNEDLRYSSKRHYKIVKQKKCIT
jgi:hypothetical protein